MPPPPWGLRLVSELDAADARATALARSLTAAQLNWKPSPAKWSIGQCLEHLCVATEVYLPPIADSLKGHSSAEVQEIALPWFGGAQALAWVRGSAALRLLGGRMSRAAAVASLVVALIAALSGQGPQPAANQPPAPSRALPQVTQEFISVDAPVVVLQHVRVIDGTGAPAVSDQTVVIEGGLIKSIAPSGSTPPPAGARVLDLAGRSVMPGWVGMHEHLFYTGSTGRGRVPARYYRQWSTASAAYWRRCDDDAPAAAWSDADLEVNAHRRRADSAQDSPHRPVSAGRGFVPAAAAHAHRSG